MRNQSNNIFLVRHILTNDAATRLSVQLPKYLSNERWSVCRAKSTRLHRHHRYAWPSAIVIVDSQRHRNKPYDSKIYDPEKKWDKNKWYYRFAHRCFAFTQWLPWDECIQQAKRDMDKHILTIKFHPITTVRCRWFKERRGWWLRWISVQDTLLCSISASSLESMGSQGNGRLSVVNGSYSEAIIQTKWKKVHL